MKNLFNLILTYSLFTCLADFSAGAAPVLSPSATSPRDTAAVVLPEFRLESQTVKKDLRSTAATRSITDADINRMGITDLSDAIHRMPGVNLRDHGGSGTLKTISVRGLGTQHTGVSYDGVSLSDVQSGQIDLSRYSLDNVSGMTLVVGDNEDIFMPARAAASASSLLLSSWRPTAIADSAWQLSAQIRSGSFGYVSPYLKVGKSNGSDLAFLVTGDFTHADNNFSYTIPNGNEPIHDKRNNAKVNQGHAEANLLWKPTAASALTAKLYYFDSFQHLPGPAILYVNDSHETLKDCNMFGQVNYRIRLSGIFSLNTLAKFNWSKTRYRDFGSEYPGGLLNRLYMQREAYGSASLFALPARGLSLVYAVDYFYNDLRSNMEDYSRPHRNSILNCISAKYNVWRITLTARGLLSVYDDSPGSGEKSRTHTRFSPGMGFSLRPVAGQDFFVRFNYKNIFRMPSFNELYFDHYGSINLDPEITDQLNLGLTYGLPTTSWLKNCQFTADAYYNTVKNKIVAVPYNMFVWTMTNMGKVRAFGLDVTLAATFRLHRNQDLILSGNYSWQRAQARTSRDKLDWNCQLPYTPLHAGAFSVTWDNPWVSLGFHGSGCGERYATKENLPSSRMPGYMDFGFMAYHTFRFRHHELELRADLINAFDKRYEIVARYPMPGRSWQFSVKFTL